MRRLYLHLQLLLIALCLQRVPAAHVYMQFNGQGYEYNTDGATTSAVHQFSPSYQQSQSLSRNYEQTHSQSWPYSSGNARSYNSIRQQWGWTQAQPEQFDHSAHTEQLHYPDQPVSSSLPSSSQANYNINLHTPHMTHTQHTDAAGHVLGKYSYYDNAGYHELSYKAGAGIGFVVMGGNLAKPTQKVQYEYE